MSRHDKVNRGRAPGPQPAPRGDRAFEEVAAGLRRRAEEFSFEQAERMLSSACNIPEPMLTNTAGRGSNLAEVMARMGALEREAERARESLSRSLTPNKVILCHPDNLALLTRSMPPAERDLLGLPPMLFGVMVAADPNMERTTQRRTWVPPDWGPLWKLGPEDEYLAALGLGTYEVTEVPAFFVLDLDAFKMRYDVTP